MGKFCPFLRTNYYFCWINFKNIVMSISDNLKKIRNRRNVSQQEVADFLGIDRKTYVNWESGSADIKSSFVPKLAEFLNVDINDLFREKPAKIIINQQNTDNKDNSINGIVILLTDKSAVDQLIEVVKERFNGLN